MRVATVALTLCLAVGPALAQAPKAAPLGGPPAAAAPKKTSDPGASLSTNARALLQFDLAWTGDYNGLITGAPGERTTAAVKSFQKSHGLKETGNLAPPERAQLAAASKQKQEEVGWRMVDDRATGARIGLATKQVPLTGEGKTGTRWFSAQRQVQIETFRIREPGTTLASVFEQQKQDPAGRQIELNVLKSDFFVLSGTQGLKKFYVRAEIRDDEVRGMTILYDRATEGVMDPVVVVMSSAFAPFSGSGIASLIAPPDRRKVEYGSGVVVSAAGHVLTDRAVTDQCNAITIAGHGNVGKLAEAGDLALLRIYGPADLVPLPLLEGGTVKSADLTFVGIADPQAQGGGNVVSTVAAGHSHDPSPAPPPGFGGAAILDADGNFVGLLHLQSTVLFNASSQTVLTSETIVPASALQKFLGAQSVTPATGRGSVDAARAAMVRVICVRD